MTYITMKTITIVIIFAVLVSIASAWGTTGHKTVAALAEKMLSQTAAKKIATWLGSTDSMVSVAIEPDIYRYGGGKWTSSFHYANLPRSATNFTMQQGCPKTCVVTAIQNYTNILLKTPPYPDIISNWLTEEPSPVSFLVHFVGDIHQPLHISYSDDLGGNSVKVEWFNSATNLHSVWDEGIINQTGMFWPDLTDSLWNYMIRNPSFAPKYGSEMDPVVWAEESFQITRQVYAQLPPKPIELGQEYFNQYWPVVQQRLIAGGIRLGRLLNLIFGFDD